MEQRAPGHTVLDGKLYAKGLLGLRGEAEGALRALEGSKEADARGRREELEGMIICADALIALARRYASAAEEAARKEKDQARQAELEEIARVCRRVPGHPPATFREALQAYWFVHLGVITELNPWDAFNPGRLDQHLIRYYRAEREAGTLTREEAKEFLECFWVKFNNQPAPPKVGVTAEESSTYTDFANINSGGLTRDGRDGVNEVTYLVLEVIDEMKLVQPSSNIQLSALNPEEFLRAACRVVRHGRGQPSIFNADAVVQEMVLQGKTVEDARDGGTSGCVETGAFGKEAYILTGYFNLPKILELTLHDGVNPATGRRLGPSTGDPAAFGSFDALMEAFTAQVRYFADVKVRGSNAIERIYAERMPVPLLSLLSALQYHVYDTGGMSIASLLEILRDDFRGHERERLALVNRTPRYGNDDDRADGIMRRVFELYHDAVNGRPNTRGGAYRINLLPTTCHIYFGSVTGATPDGRRAGTPLSEGISPVQGADRHGPTAVLKSAGKMDHVRTGGTLLNQKFTPQLLADETGIQGVSALVRSYFRMGGHHIQFNVVDAATLRKAQDSPAEYRDLIVRVAGYSDYFCDLGKALQDEIIARTEHADF